MAKEASTPGAEVAVRSARQRSVEYMAVQIRWKGRVISKDETRTRGHKEKERDGQNC